MSHNQAKQYKFIASLVGVGVVSIVLLFGRVFGSDSDRYVFLLWNLVLASIAPMIAGWLVVRIRKFGWLHWKQIAITGIWLVFLPNSFYLPEWVLVEPNYAEPYPADMTDYDNIPWDGN
jgi:hypothetical protein